MHFVDLHIHSNTSDGSFSVEELIDIAVANHLSKIALCDHDTTAGINRFVSYGKEKGITAVAGIELSATWNKGNFHVVGYGVSSGYKPLELVLQEIRDSREKRNVRIVDKLQSLGIEISLDDVETQAGGNVVARPHIAQVLKEKEYVASTQEAFDRYLAKGAPGYVDRYRLEPESAIELLKESGAKVVLAHPSQLKISLNELETLLKTLKPKGLDGVEVYTPYASDSEIFEYEKLTKKYSLFCTGGSDFHGKSKPDHKMGYYRNNVKIPEYCAEIIGTQLYG